MATVLQVIAGAWARGLQPPPDLLVSEWATEHRKVTSPSPEPGPWRNSRTPYLVQIMDCCSPSHPAREIDFQKGTQIGGTEAALNVVGFYSHQAPNSGLIVLPSKDVAAEWSRIRFTGLFESTPALERLLIDRDRRKRSNTLYQKRLAGGVGTWKIAWSSSGKVLRSTPAAIVVADEVDGFVRQVAGEGEPIELLRKRFANFRRGKFLRLSSPTDRTGSRIERGFREGDQRYYFVPCPECGHFQRLVFAQLVWPKGDADNLQDRIAQAHYTCIGCETAIREHRKTEMLERGVWVATKQNPVLSEEGFSAEERGDLDPILRSMAEENHPSFHLSALYSPLGWYSWASCAEDWEKSQGDVERLKVFIMTVLAETWVDRGEAPDWEKIYNRREGYEEGVVPRGGLFLTAGVDVQADRLEVEIVAWGRGKESWSITYLECPGDTSTAAPWSLLEDVLARDWPTWDGMVMPIMAMAIDSGFRPQNVYDFARRHAQPAHSQAGSRIVATRTVIPTKGGSALYQIMAGVSASDAARKRGGVKIVTIGTPAVKQDIYDCLRQPAPSEGEAFPAGYCHFPLSYKAAYFQGLCSESRITRTNGKTEWIKAPGTRNEPLDIRGEARLAAALYGIDRFTDRNWIDLGWNPDLQRIVATLAKPKASEQPVVNHSPPQEDRSPSWFGDRRNWLSR